MKTFFFILLCIPVAGVAQNRLHLTLFGGFSNYQGDLQEKRFTMDQSNGAFGIGAKYDITSRFSVRSEIKYGTLEASDKKNMNQGLRSRNLSFESNLFELNLLGEYTFFDLSDKRISPFIFGGVAVYRFNPHAYDSLGNKLALKPLSTEGQGLSQYPDVKAYNLTQLSIPFGGGVKFRISDNTVLGFEIGLRKLFTDYLDDVSGVYADPAILMQERGSRSVEMSYRGGELKDGDPDYPATGTIRGGAKFKDWYYFSGLTLAVGINAGNGKFRAGSKRGGTGCPTNVL